MSRRHVERVLGEAADFLSEPRPPRVAFRLVGWKGGEGLLHPVGETVDPELRRLLPTASAG